jgi:hypothetical protein
MPDPARTPVSDMTAIVPAARCPGCRRWWFRGRVRRASCSTRIWRPA